MILENELKELNQDTAADRFIYELSQKSGKPVNDMSDEQILEVIGMWSPDAGTQELVRDYLKRGKKKDLIRLLTPEKYYFPEGASVSISKSARYVQTSEFHDHDYFEIECVLEGEAEHHSLLGDYLLKKNDIVLIPPHVRHDLDVTGRGTVINLGIRSSTFRTEFADILKNDVGVSSYFEKVMYGTFNSEVILRQTLDEFMTELIVLMYYKQKNSPSDNGRVTNHLMASFLFQMFERSRPDLLVDIMQSSDMKASRIRQYIYQHPDTVTLGVLSEVFYMSEAYISRYLKEKLQTGFADLVKEARMNKARELLIKTDLPVLEIAQQTGYNSQSHFIMVFRKTAGISPLQYRIRNRQELKNV